MKRYHYLLFLVIPLLSNCSNKGKADNNSVSTNDSSRYTPKKYVELTHPEWSKNATIYEVNIRQFTPEGTFKAFRGQI